MIEPATLHVHSGPVADRAIAPQMRVEDFERIEDYLRAYLDDERFASRYPLAYERWSDAWAMLWQADSREKVIAVAGEARAAMWEFAAALERHGPIARNLASTQTLERLSALIGMYRPELPDSRRGLLEALFAYWQALNDVIQTHHEHRAHRVRERLRWEDGRRVVVLSALVMVEVDRSL